MNIVNRRNAVLGWAVWQLARQEMQRKAKAAGPGTVKGTRRPNASAIATGVAAVGGGLLVWRKRRAAPEEG